MDFAKEEGYIVIEQLLFFLVLGSSIYPYLVHRLIQMLHVV